MRFHLIFTITLFHPPEGQHILLQTVFLSVINLFSLIGVVLIVSQQAQLNSQLDQRQRYGRKKMCGELERTRQGNGHGLLSFISTSVNWGIHSESYIPTWTPWTTEGGLPAWPAPFFFISFLCMRSSWLREGEEHLWTRSVSQSVSQPASQPTSQPVVSFSRRGRTAIYRSPYDLQFRPYNDTEIDEPIFTKLGTEITMPLEPSPQ